MKEGWWINYRRGSWFPIHEHELWIRDEANARRLGVPRELFRRFGRFRPVADRDRFLFWLMGRAPVMRVRDHGEFVTFEFSSRSRRRPLAALAVFAGKETTPPTCLHIVNLATREAVAITAADFRRKLRRAGASVFWRGHARRWAAAKTNRAAVGESSDRPASHAGRWLIQSGRCGYRYHDLGHGAGAILWWIGRGGRMRTRRSDGSVCHSNLPELGAKMDATWRGRLDPRTGTATLCPPPAADAEIKPGPAPVACRRLLRRLMRLGARRFYIDTREGLRRLNADQDE
jgi:hypothetical protein